MLIGWTTVSARDDALRLATQAIEQGLAACVQTDGPVVSIYRWQGKLERADEFRLMFKFLPEKQVELSRWLHANHPYDTPEWLVVPASEVGEKYLSWAKANSSTPPL